MSPNYYSTPKWGVASFVAGPGRTSQSENSQSNQRHLLMPTTQPSRSLAGLSGNGAVLCVITVVAQL
jgi:hypothetical protein